jgi:hypothetical protein
MMQTFATPAPISAVVGVPAGRIRFVAAGRDSTTVEIRPANPAKSRDVKLAGQTTAVYAGGILQVMSQAGNRILGSSGAVEVTVHLPAGSRVEAKAGSAQFTTEGQLGVVTFDSSQATVKVEEAAAARLATVDGDITVGRLGGDTQIRTVRGDIAITEAARGTLVLSTQAGAITVGAAAGVCAALDAGTTLGRISNALRNSDGTPALSIHATTTVGDITARSL